jgi:hypothetical protein
LNPVGVGPPGGGYVDAIYMNHALAYDLLIEGRYKKGLAFLSVIKLFSEYLLLHIPRK